MLWAPTVADIEATLLGGAYAAGVECALPLAHTFALARMLAPDERRDFVDGFLAALLGIVRNSLGNVDTTALLHELAAQQRSH